MPTTVGWLLATCVHLGALLVALTGSAPAAELALTRFVMPNGLTALVIEQHALPIVQIQALIKAGSAQDPPEKAGLANLVASLLDEGTESRSAKQIADEIEFVGGQLTVNVTEDYTRASARVLTKDVTLGFELLADVLLHPTFPEPEIERVRRQILGEILSEKEDPGLVAAKAFYPLVFAGHPYGWPVNGTEESVPKITRSDIQQFYAREFLPNQTILAVVGDVTVKQARDYLSTYFGAWKRGLDRASSAVAPSPVEKPMTRLIDKDVTQASIILGHVGISRSNPDFYAVAVMNYILGSGGFSSRLMDSIRGRQGLAYGVYSSFEANRMPGAFLVSLQTRNEMANQAIAGVMAELNGIRDAPVTDQELADAKAYLMGSFPLRLDTTAKLALLSCLVELHGLGLDYFTQYPEWIKRVTKADVLRVAKQYLHPDRSVLVLVGNLDEAKIGQ